MLPSHVKIPDEMRATAERSVDQTKDAFNRYMQATQEIVSTVGDQVALSHVAALDLGKKRCGSPSATFRRALSLLRKLFRPRTFKKWSGCKRSSFNLNADGELGPNH